MILYFEMLYLCLDEYQIIYADNIAVMAYNIIIIIPRYSQELVVTKKNNNKMVPKKNVFLMATLI